MGADEESDYHLVIIKIGVSFSFIGITKETSKNTENRKLKHLI